MTTATHATSESRCANCGADQSTGLTLERGRWLCFACLPLPTAACGCTRAAAYRHTPAEGFTCRHGNQV